MQRDAGYSLLEVMLSSTILATALLGLAALANASLLDLAYAHDRFVAAMLARDLEGRIALHGEPGDWSETERSAWRQDLANRLPQGHGLWCTDGTPDDGHPGAPACDGSGPLQLKLFWRRGGEVDWQRLHRRLVP